MSVHVGLSQVSLGQVRVGLGPGQGRSDEVRSSQVR